MTIGLLDRLRIERAVLALDFWLDVRGVRRRRRRDLREELRDNLTAAAAAADGGAGPAIAALGPIRELAAGYAPLAEHRPDAIGGTVWAGASFIVIVTLSLAAVFTWADASLASGATLVSGTPFVAPWLALEFEELASGFSMAVRVNWWILLVPVIGFALGARVWRVARRATVAS